MTQPSDGKPQMKIAANTYTDQYTFTVCRSDEHPAAFAGRCAEFQKLEYLGDTSENAIAGIRRLVRGLCDEMAAAGAHLPLPGDRGFEYEQSHFLAATMKIGAEIKEQRMVDMTSLDAFVESETKNLSGWIDAVLDPSGDANLKPAKKEDALRHFEDVLRKAYSTARSDATAFEKSQANEPLKRVLQHALNVLVAFRIRATDRTVYLLKDMTASDLETAVSVAELTRLAIEHKCEGIDLLTKPPVEIITEEAIRDTRTT